MHRRVLFATGYGADELTDRFLATTDVPLARKPFHQMSSTVAAQLPGAIRFTSQ